MSIIKKGEVESIVVVSFCYICNKCGFTKTITSEGTSPKCEICQDGLMILAHSEAEIK